MGRLSNRVPLPLSARALGVAFALSAGGLLIAGAVLPLGPFAGFIGVFAAGFGLGLASGRRRYLELALAGAATGAVGTVFEHLLVTVVGNVGVPVAAIGAGGGLAAAVAGHYFGRDLRDGLTRSVTTGENP